MARAHGRKAEQLRHINFETDINIHAEGSVLTSFGNTQVICTASIEQTVPNFLRGRKSGWVTAEYSMLPRATSLRNKREAAIGKQGGRTLEIQRLIARALRSVVDLHKLGERTITVDCDVVQADGSTRTASITGGFIALAIALRKVKLNEALTGAVAAVSVGVLNGETIVDLDYSEDSNADTDMNLVMTDAGYFVELQGTAEGSPFSDQQLTTMLLLGRKGIIELLEMQKQSLHRAN